jgi:hypothetical protein
METKGKRLRYRVVLIGVATMLVLGTGSVIAYAMNGDAQPPAWHSAPVAGSPSPKAQLTTPPPSTAPAGEVVTDTVSFSATGDIIMAQAPSRIPPNGGRGFFDGVKQALKADLVMGNLEEPVTEDTGYRKCGANSTDCHQFRAPPGYANYLHDAGFELLNLANNHANDFGPAGHRNTQKTLEDHGLAHTGDPGQITVVTVKGVRVAVLGFSSYSWSNSLIDLDEARSVVRRAASQAQIVVVQVHMGAEGSGATRVRPGTEMFLGENRGDPIKFAHTVIDAGADLVVGHGPHVMRAMEFYRGRLIAYSMGNFAGGAGTLVSAGNLGLGGVLKVTLKSDGSWSTGSLISTTHQTSGGLPKTDGRQRSVALVRSLTQSDFPASGAKLGPNGAISPPA